MKVAKRIRKLGFLVAGEGGVVLEVAVKVLVRRNEEREKKKVKKTKKSNN